MFEYLHNLQKAVLPLKNHLQNILLTFLAFFTPETPFLDKVCLIKCYHCSFSFVEEESLTYMK